MSTEVDPADRPAPPPRQNILIVDDEEDITSALRDTIEAYLEDVDVLVASNGAEALNLMERHSFDLILTDYRMPGMNGIEFLREARRKAPTVPRIMITAFPDMDLVIRALNDEHILNFIPKPLRRENVIQVVALALAERKAQTVRNRYLAASLESLRRGRQA